MMQAMTSSSGASSDQSECWICGCSQSAPFKKRSIERALTPDDLKISDANYGTTLALRRCAACGFISADRTDLSALFELYERLDDSGYEESQDSRALQMDWLLATAEKAHPRIRSILDVGAASGLLVSLAKKRGWEAQGVEPSQKLVDAAERFHGVQLLQGQLPHPGLQGRRFDVVFLVDVIEHVADPVGLLRHAANVMAPDGILVVVTPDVGRLASRLLGPRWWHFRLAHVGYFNDATFAEACKRSNLVLSSQFRAKWFFRVKYLAERMTRYLPVSGLIRRLESTRSGARAANWLVPLNLHDSWVFICKPLRGNSTN
jgi:2-polyprenyl-3-methyl-5-hydroxy-6-metoxy-1,4-benzoquinol methylase